MAGEGKKLQAMIPEYTAALGQYKDTETRNAIQTLLGQARSAVRNDALAASIIKQLQRYPKVAGAQAPVAPKPAAPPPPAPTPEPQIEPPEDKPLTCEDVAPGFDLFRMFKDGGNWRFARDDPQMGQYIDKIEAAGARKHLQSFLPLVPRIDAATNKGTQWRSAVQSVLAGTGYEGIFVVPADDAEDKKATGTTTKPDKAGSEIEKNREGQEIQDVPVPSDRRLKTPSAHEVEINSIFSHLGW